MNDVVRRESFIDAIPFVASRAYRVDEQSYRHNPAMTTTPVDAMLRVYGLESKCLALEADCARWESLAKENESALDKAKAQNDALEVVQTNAIAERDATIRALENRGTICIMDVRVPPTPTLTCGVVRSETIDGSARAHGG